jgi:hypothetical protein
MSESIFDRLERAEREAEEGRGRLYKPEDLYREDIYDNLLYAAEGDDDSEREYESEDEPPSDVDMPEPGESYISKELGFNERQQYTVGKSTSAFGTGAGKLDKFQQRLSIINMTSKERTDMVLEAECQRLGYSQDITLTIVEQSLKDKLRAYRNPTLYCIVFSAFIQGRSRRGQSQRFLDNLYSKTERFQQVDVYRYKMLIESILY